MGLSFIYRDTVLYFVNKGLHNKSEIIKESEFINAKSVIHFNPLLIAYKNLLDLGFLEEKDGKTYLTEIGKEYAKKGYKAFIDKEFSKK